MDLYGSLLRHVMFPAFEELRGRPTVGLLRYLERSQWASADELTAIQDGFVRRLTNHAYAHTAHYKAQWDALGMSPHDLTSAAALAALPVLDREPAISSADLAWPRRASRAAVAHHQLHDQFFDGDVQAVVVLALGADELDLAATVGLEDRPERRLEHRTIRRPDFFGAAQHRDRVPGQRHVVLVEDRHHDLGGRLRGQRGGGDH